ncbi:MAG TPA: sigma-70 family RNA polymerase sigma factor [Verrucomicrobiae bacterium]|nr:sigma-70 family RNA polymerase sigma factor [Verrucomicrobiae bacterium]
MMITEMTNLPVVADADLVSRCLAGDRDAFGSIVSRYQTLICSLAYSATGSLGQSEDLAQETFITAWKHLRHLREPGKLRAWLCGLARNRINSFLRREGRRPLRHAEPLDCVEEHPAAGPLPTESAMTHEEQALLWRALESVPQLYREPLVLFYREHQSVEAVAAALELSEDAVKQRLSRGRKLVQEAVLSFVEHALERTSPTKVFTAAVLLALPVLAGSASAATLGATAAKGTMAAKAGFSLGIGGAILGPLVGIAGGILGTRIGIANTESPRERRFMVRMAAATWSLAIGFFIVMTLFGVVVMPRFKTHPAAVAWGFIGLAAGYCVLLFALIFWGNRAQRRIRQEEAALRPAEAHTPNRRFRSQPFEYRSRASFLGLPLVHVRMECKQDGKTLPAKGWIALGNVAYGGLFACAGVAIAPISMGGVAIGLLSLGGFAIGLLSYAGLAIGAWAAGGAALGYAAFGGGAAGWLAAQGGCALAHGFAQGGVASALHANDEPARLFFQSSIFFGYVARSLQYMMVLVWVPVGLTLWQFQRLRRNHG